MAGSDDAAESVDAIRERLADVLGTVTATAFPDAFWRSIDRVVRGTSTEDDAAGIVGYVAAVHTSKRRHRAFADDAREFIGDLLDERARLLAEVDRLRRPSLREAAGIVAAWIRGGER